MARIGDTEREYVRDVLDSDFRTSAGGSMTRRLEQVFSKTFECNYAVSFCNGTATMHAALVAADVGPGDQVIVPPLTMASTSLAVIHAGAAPVFADIDPDTWTIDPSSVQGLITDHTKAVIPVAIYGLSPDLDPIMSLANRHNLFVLEDDAQCFLGYYKDRLVGSIGHASSFSFQSSKHMTSGEGGMIVTNDEDLADGIRRFNSLGYAAVGAAPGEGKITKEVIQDPTYERHASVGWNYRMPELCAAVALGQLERLENLVRMRLKVAELFRRAIRECAWLVPQAVPQAYGHAYWSYVVKLDNEDDFTWYDFQKKYVEMGGDGIYGAWQLTYLEPAFRNLSQSRHYASCLENATQEYGPGLCPVAESLQPRLLQFKTNYMDLALAQQNAEALVATVRYFD